MMAQSQLKICKKSVRKSLYEVEKSLLDSRLEDGK